MRKITQHCSAFRWGFGLVAVCPDIQMEVTLHIIHTFKCRHHEVYKLPYPKQINIFRSIF